MSIPGCSNCQPETSENLPVCRLFGLAAALYLCEPEEGIIQGLPEDLMPPGSPAQAVSVLRREYWDLFCIPVSGRYLPPFESAQREGRLDGPSRQRVQELYLSTGFNPEKVQSSPYWHSRRSPDHIGFELSFFAHLLVSNKVGCGGDTNQGIEILSHFFGYHLRPWAGAYGRQVEAKAHTKLYRFLGQLTQELVE